MQSHAIAPLFTIAAYANSLLACTTFDEYEQAFGSLLHLCLDPRPKVRKRAAELVRDVLSSPPPPLLRHPYADRAAEWTVSTLADLTGGGMPKFKGKKAETDGTDTAIHLLAFLRPILPMFPLPVRIQLYYPSYI